MTDEGYACRFCVDGVEAARLIVLHLSRAFAFQTSEPMQVGSQPSQRIFRVAYGSELTQKDLVRLLSYLPGLRLQVATAAKPGSSQRQRRL